MDKKYLKRISYTPANPESFGGTDILYRSLIEEMGLKVNKKQIMT